MSLCLGESGACGPSEFDDASRSSDGGHDMSSPAHVLIVEDSPIVRERLITIVKGLQLGTRVSTAESATIGRRMFALCNPDVVLLEIALPETSGFELLAEIKTERPSCIVMMLTSCGYAASPTGPQRLRADYMLTKSLEYEGISHVLTSLARR